MSLTITGVIKNKKNNTRYFSECEEDLDKLETFRVFRKKKVVKVFRKR